MKEFLHRLHLVGMKMDVVGIHYLAVDNSLYMDDLLEKVGRKQLIKSTFK